MEQALRDWLRYSTILGMYMSSPVQTLYTNATHYTARRVRCRNRLKMLYLHALLLWMCALYINGLIQRKPVPGTMLSWLVATLFFSSQALSNFLIVAEGIWRLHEQEAFLTLIHEIAVSLKLRLRQDVHEDWLVRRVCFLLKYLLLLSLVCVCFFVYYFEDLQYIGYFHYSIWYAVTMRLRLIQVLIYVRVLCHYMECLSLKLEQVVAYRMAPSRQLMDVNYEKLQSLDCLLAIKDIYSLLFRAFQLLNDFVGWSLASIIVCYMLDYGCTIYWALLSWEGYLERRNYYVPLFWWLFPMTVIIWHICYLCDSCKRLDRLLAAQLCKIIIMRSSKSLTTHRLLLYQFATQLQLQFIEVKAKNFFVLDLHLIMSIFTSIATYLIMIIQFLSIQE